MTLYLVLKFIHVFAAIIFVGNITIGIFWKTYADCTRNLQIIAHTVAGIIQADRIFTIPAIFLLLIGGFGAAAVGHWSILGTGWILWGLTLFVIAGVAFGPVARAQRALLAVAQQGVSSGKMDWAQYAKFSGTWNVAGSISTGAAIIAVAVMVLKPPLPHF